MSSREIRVLDLFAGAGGFTAGFHAGSDRVRSVGAVELDRAAAASYSATFGKDGVHAGSVADWLETEPMPEDVDIVIGGPPCQGFSMLGKRDEADERNRLWFDYAQVLTRVRPRYFVVENVAAFARSEQFVLFQEATKRGGFLSDYDFDFKILNAADYGTPQARKRAVLIGYHRDSPNPGFPSPTNASTATKSSLPPHLTVNEALSAVPLQPDRDHLVGSRLVKVGDKLMNGPFAIRDLHWSRAYSELSKRRFAAIPPGGNRHNLPDELLARCWVNHKSGSGDVMGRLYAERPSVTIRTEFFKPEKGRYLHPTADRAITHYEAALLQGFGRDHKFVGSRTAIARQIGNAVPIPLGAALGRHLASQI